MRWRIGAILALASSLVVGYWEAIVPHPGAHPRLVARAPAGTAARLATLDATLVSFDRGSSGQDGGPGRVPDGAVLLVATVDISGAGGAEQPSVECQLRVAAPDGGSWLPLGPAPAPAPACGAGAGGRTASRYRAWFAVPPDVELRRLVVEVRTVGVEPRAVQLIPAPFG